MAEHSTESWSHRDRAGDGADVELADPTGGSAPSRTARDRAAIAPAESTEPPAAGESTEPPSAGESTEPPAAGTSSGSRSAGTSSGSRSAGRHAAPPLPSADSVGRTRRWSLFAGEFRAALPAILAYAALRVLCMATLLIWAHHRGVAFGKIVRSFDMAWYVDVAAHGYDHAIGVLPNGTLDHTNLAFFPLYPALIRGLATVLPISYVTAGLLIDWVASLVAAWGLFAIGRLLYNRRVGILVAVTWAVLPYAIDESLNLTESLFTAIAAWCLYALLKRRWLTAGVLSLVAGLSRPTAVALIGAVGVAAVIALVRREGAWWRPVVACVLAPLGYLGYLAFVAIRLHRFDGWFYVQSKSWLSSFDGGRYTGHMVIQTLTGTTGFVEPYVTTIFLGVFVVLLVLSVLERQPWPLVTYSAVFFVATVVETGYFHTEPRHLLPAFPVLLPLAAGLARARTRNMVAVIASMTVFAAWYGGYLALLWKLSY